MIPFHRAKQTLMTLNFLAILLVGIAVYRVWAEAMEPVQQCMLQ